MNDWKEKLTEFYKKINPEKKGFECYENSDINELREIRNMFNDEASKFQKLIDEKILEQHDVFKFENKFIELNEDILINVQQVERRLSGFSLLGTGVEFYEDSINISLNCDYFVNYKNVDLLKIISEKEYKNRISKHLKKILREANL